MGNKNGKKSRNRLFESNRNSRITSSVLKTGTLLTATTRRDVGTPVVEVKSKNNGSGPLRLFIRDDAGGTVALDGHGARTVYTVLEKHYQRVGRPLGLPCSSYSY